MKKMLNSILCAGLPKRDIQNANKVNLWCLIWVVTLGISTYMFDYEEYRSWPYLLSAVVINGGSGIALVFAYKKLLVNLDEMERKIQLEALALSVGVTIVAYSVGSILVKADFLTKLEPAHLIVAISLGYIVGLISGRVRHS